MEKQRYQPYKNIDAYISGFPEDIQVTLQKIRQAIKKAAPQAEEAISYGMPAFRQNGVLVYFAAFKDHIGFFPASSGVANFTKELAGYSTSKGTVRFPLNAPIPYPLIEKITRFRVAENLDKVK